MWLFPGATEALVLKYNKYVSGLQTCLNLETKFLTRDLTWPFKKKLNLHFGFASGLFQNFKNNPSGLGSGLSAHPIPLLPRVLQQVIKPPPKPPPPPTGFSRTNMVRKFFNLYPDKMELPQAENFKIFIWDLLTTKG